MGRATAPLSVSQIAAIMDMLATRGGDGVAVAIDVLNMVIFCAGEKTAEYRTALQRYCALFVSRINWTPVDLSNENFIHHVQEVIEFGLSAPDSSEAAISALRRLVDFGRSASSSFPHRIGNVLQPFLRKHPREALDALYARGEEQEKTLFMISLRLNRDKDTALEAVPEADLLAWCEELPPDRFEFAAHGCKLFERPDQAGRGAEAVGLASVAKKLVALAPNRSAVFEILLGRFSPTCWSGSRAAIMRGRFRLLDEFKVPGDRELECLVEAAKARAAERVVAEELWEQKTEMAETRSFE